MGKKVENECPSCLGNGWVVSDFLDWGIHSECETCGGSGKMKTEEFEPLPRRKFTFTWCGWKQVAFGYVFDVQNKRVPQVLQSPWRALVIMLGPCEFSFYWRNPLVSDAEVDLRRKTIANKWNNIIIRRVESKERKVIGIVGDAELHD